MDYNGKKIFGLDDFSFENVAVGGYVSEEVVSTLMNMLPPVCYRADCSQVGEPYSHREDPATGKWRATYTTFKCVIGTYPNRIWEYCGHCFCGQNVEPEVI